MVSTDTELTVIGRAWLRGASEADDYYVDGQSAKLEVTRSERNEIRLELALSGGAMESDSSEGDFYLTDAEASRLAHMLGAKVLQEEVD